MGAAAAAAAAQQSSHPAVVGRWPPKPRLPTAPASQPGFRAVGRGGLEVGRRIESQALHCLYQGRQGVEGVHLGGCLNLHSCDALGEVHLHLSNVVVVVEGGR